MALLSKLQQLDSRKHSEDRVVGDREVGDRGVADLPLSPSKRDRTRTERELAFQAGAG